MICNKIDRLEGVEPYIERNQEGLPIRVWVSAQQGLGMDLLLRALGECLAQDMVKHELRIPPQQGKIRGALLNLNCILDQAYSEHGEWLVTVRMPFADWNRLKKHVDTHIDTYIVKSY